MTYDYNQFLMDLILKGDHHLINNLHNPSFDQLKQLVDKELFAYFPDHLKTEEICLYSVKLHWSNVAHIKNASEKVQLAAVIRTGYAVGLIKNPSEAAQLAAVKKTEDAINHIKNPLPSVVEYCKK